MLFRSGRSERRSALGHYLTGLLLEGERKSIEPMAARLVEDPKRVEAMRQRLQQAVCVAKWDDNNIWRRLALKLEKGLESELSAWVVDDTGFPKKGKYSVGVARQYSGTLGRIDNCQIAVSLHFASEKGSGCLGMDLFLPEAWTDDRERCRSVGVPDGSVHKTKWQISISQIDRALSFGMKPQTVLADAGYGVCGEYREELEQRGLHYVVAIKPTHLMWPLGSDPKRPEKLGTAGRPHTRYRDGDFKPTSIEEVIAGLNPNEFQQISWREGSKKQQRSNFFVARIRLAERHTKGAPPSQPLWLLVEWPKGEASPSRFWVSNLPAETPVLTLVRYAKLRWRIERDYQELKQEIGLDHFEGRTWNGFHHHVLLCCLAHGFLALKRALFPPREKTHIVQASAAYSANSSRENWLLLSLRSKSKTALSESTHV